MSKVILDKTMDSPVFEYNKHTIEFAVKDDVNPAKWGFYSDGDFIELNPLSPPKLPNNIILGTPIVYTSTGYYTGAYNEAAQITATIQPGTYIEVKNVAFCGYNSMVGFVTRTLVSGTLYSLGNGGKGMGSYAHDGGNSSCSYAGSYVGAIRVEGGPATVRYYTTNAESTFCDQKYQTVVTVVLIPVTFKDPE